MKKNKVSDSGDGIGNEDGQTYEKDKIIIAFFLGAILAGIIVFLTLPFLSNHLNQLFISFALIIFLLGIFALFFTIYKEYFFKKIFGISKADIEDVSRHANSISENVILEDWEKVREDFKVLTKKGVAWYSWYSYRRWVINVFYVLFLAFAGLLGSVLLYNQNQLLLSQNEKVDIQIELEESNRRGNLIVMMSNIMDKVDDELSNDWQNDGIRNLSPQLISRIIALSNSFRPYRFWTNNSLIKSPLSSERGQLLMALANSKLHKSTYMDIFEKANFENSNLEGVNLSNLFLRRINLKGANLSNSNLENSDLIGAKLENVKFTNANLEGVNFNGANLMNANLKKASIINITFSISTNFTDTYLDSTIMAKRSWENLNKNLSRVNKNDLVQYQVSKIDSVRNIFKVPGEYWVKDTLTMLVKRIN